MTLTVGLIGCGHIGSFHARNLKTIQSRRLADVRYHAACDLDLDRARRFADLAGCPVVTAEAAEVIDCCDAIYVCTETAEHSHLAAAAAQANKHLFCEKPLGRSLPEAESMATAVARSDAVNQVGLVLDFSPVYRVLEDLLTEDHGPLLTAHLRDDQFFPIGGEYGSTWRADVERAGSGTLLEHSIHDVNLLARLFGPIERVHCHTRNLAGHPGIEDVAMATFQHQGGHRTTLTSVWHQVASRPSSRHLEVFCERARFETFDDYFGTLTVERQDRGPATLSTESVLARFMDLEGLGPEAEDLRSLAALSDRRFLAAASSGAACSGAASSGAASSGAACSGAAARPTFDQALTAHRVVDACYRSAALQEEVAVRQ